MYYVDSYDNDIDIRYIHNINNQYMQLYVLNINLKQ